MKLKISNSPTQNELEEIDLSITTKRGVEYLIGRSPDSDLVLDSEDVSRHHGKFFSQSGNYYFSDLGSRNGTIINGKIAEKNHSYILKNGDIIRIGDFALIMEEDISVSQQSETVMRIITPEMFSNRKGSQNTSVVDVATPSSVDSESIANETPIAKEINNEEEFVNSSEELTFVQYDEEFPTNADIVIPENAVELQEENEVSDVIIDESVDSDTLLEEATANTSSDEPEYTIVQRRDVFQDKEDSIDSEAEEIVVKNQEEDAQEAITQEDNSYSEAEEIDAQELLIDEDNIDSDVEEIVFLTQEEDAQQTKSETIEVVSSKNTNLDTPITAELEELVSKTAFISTSSQETQKDAVENIPLQESFIKIAKILEDKQIILISHETKKSKLTELVAEHEEFLSYCITRTWQTFSDYLCRETGLSVTQEIPPPTSGGYQAINSLINSKEIIAVIFLRDFITPQPGQASEEALLRTCNINEVLLATNLPTAQAVIHYLKNIKD